MDGELYFLLNKDEDFSRGTMRDLIYSDGRLSMSGDAKRGVFVSPVIDGGEAGWKRVHADCSIPEGAGLIFTFYASDFEDKAEAIKNHLLSAPPYVGWHSDSPEGCTRLKVYDGGDFPINTLKGRYLVFHCGMYAQGRRRPSLKYIQIWQCEESLTRYLPEIYREPEGFLERFLRIFAIQYRDMERAVEWIAEKLDPKTAPPESLELLAEFMHIDYVRLWETEALRSLLTEGIYPRRKGTLSGLERVVALFVGRSPLIAESFRYRTGIEENDVLYEGAALVIILPGGVEAALLEPLHLIIQAFIPAGVSYTLVLASDSIILNNYSYLGVNSCISDYTPAGLDRDGGMDYVLLGQKRRKGSGDIG